MRKILYIYGGPEFHPTELGGKILAPAGSRRTGRFELEMTTDLDAFIARCPAASTPRSCIYATGFKDDLTPEREQGLLDFVRGGGGFVGIHSATDSFRGSRAYVDMLNGEFLHPPRAPRIQGHTDASRATGTASTVSISDLRMPDFSDLRRDVPPAELRPGALHRAGDRRSGRASRCRWLTRGHYGEGRVAYVALGHTAQSWQPPGVPEAAAPRHRLEHGRRAARPDDPLRPARLRPRVQHGQGPRGLDQRHAGPQDGRHVRRQPGPRRGGASRSSRTWLATSRAWTICWRCPTSTWS